MGFTSHESRFTNHESRITIKTAPPRRRAARLPAPTRGGCLPARYAAAAIEDHGAAPDTRIDVIPDGTTVERELAGRFPDRIGHFGARHATHDTAPAGTQLRSLICA